MQDHNRLRPHTTPSSVMALILRNAQAEQQLAYVLHAARIYNLIYKTMEIAITNN